MEQSKPTAMLKSPILLDPKEAIHNRPGSYARDELRSFRSWLRWMCVDQTAKWRSAMSWILFIVMGFAVPSLSHFVLLYSEKRRNYDIVVELSLTAVATLSFLCLSGLLRRLGLVRFLFIDKLCNESEIVRRGYRRQLSSSFKLLSFFVIPCIVTETVYKAWWYYVGVGRIPFFGNPIASDVITCTLELCSWLYRTSIFFLFCVLFHLICHLQILRLQDFASVFSEETLVSSVLMEHIRIRKQLKVISHRFRLFIVANLILITFSQMAALLITTESRSDVNFLNAGELAICSVGLLSGIMICLRSAAKITHKAQSITSHAAKWHVWSTIDPETGTRNSSDPVCLEDDENGLTDEVVSDYDDDGYDEIPLPHPHTISFQKRQAFVTYLENNRTGITLYGFMLDRTWLNMIFGIELTLVLWLLGKTLWLS